MRYGHVAPENPKATIVLLPGFREPAEKYFEVIREMYDEGLAVFIMDWRGQGGSDRYFEHDPMRAHSLGFDDQVRDLDFFISNIVAPNKVGPLLISAHSMGAHLTLRYLAECDSAHDVGIRGAILASPMFDIATAPFPRKVATTLARFARVGNKLGAYVPGGGPWAVGRDVFENNLLTHDLDRFKVMQRLFAENENLQIGDATFGWVYHAYESLEKLSAEKLKSIQVPVLIGYAVKDKVVEAQATVAAAAHLPQARLVPFEQARHELWMEQDQIRTAWRGQVYDFIRGRLSEPEIMPKKSRQHRFPAALRA